MSDRKTHWDDVYRRQSPNEVSWYQENPALSLRLIHASGLKTDAPIIDIGGGASTLVDRLCEAGYTDLSVLDVSANALDRTRARLAGKDCRVQWYEEDVIHFEPSRQFDLWHDRAVFHFLTRETDREAYVVALKRALSPGGHLLIMAFAIDGPKKCSGLDCVRYDAAAISTALGPAFSLQDTGHEIHLTPAGKQQKFAWFHFIHEESG